jgi:CPA2 family monovalent cation:H+ antiporter-2
MLFDPIILNDPLPILAALLIIMFGKSAAAFLIVRLFGHPTPTALMISASLAQIGEFSFILAGLGVGLELLPVRGRDIVLAGAILSIMLNPLFFAMLDRWLAAENAGGTDAVSPDAEPAMRETIPKTTLTGHVVLIGHGRVGRFIASAAAADLGHVLVIEDNRAIVDEQLQRGYAAICGNAADPEVLGAANVKRCFR